jgi:hypothetical protein
MADEWEKSRPFYEALTLARHGDETEQYGADNYGLDRRWPAYERFWRFHVAPATERPAGIAIREGVAQLVLDLILANYQTFCRVVSACDFTALLQTDVGFTRDEDWQRLLAFHDKALAEFSKTAGSAARLLTALDLPSGPVPLQREDWRSLFESHRAYQAYLVALDQESVEWVADDECRIATVLPPEEVPAARDLGRSADAARGVPRRRLVDAARNHLDDLISLLNVGLEQVIAALEPAQGSRTYLRLQGWYRG